MAFTYLGGSWSLVVDSDAIAEEFEGRESLNLNQLEAQFRLVGKPKISTMVLWFSHCNNKCQYYKQAMLKVRKDSR